MNYIHKIRFITAVMLLMMAALSVPAMAQDLSGTPATPPRIVTLEPVTLTPELTEKYSEQTVLVKIKASISESGAIDRNVQIVQSSGDAAFDQAVIDSLQKSVFTPAYTKDRQAVASTIILPLTVKVEKYVPAQPAGEAPPAQQ